MKMYLSPLGTHLIDEQKNYVGRIPNSTTNIHREGCFFSDMNDENEEHYQSLKMNNKL